MRVSEDESLRRWVVYVYKDDRCPCEYAYKSLGQGYGKGWVRLTTEPDCPHHGTARLAGHGWHAR
jgi:hypothetical protein